MAQYIEGIPENKMVEVQGHFLELKLRDLTDPVSTIFSPKIIR
jgi:hypothetical protein